MSGAQRAALRAVEAADAVNRATGSVLRWVVVVIPCITVAYSLVRALTPWGYNGWTEAQWFLYAWVYMAGAGYALQQGGHVRIDVLSCRWPRAVRWRVEIALHLLLWPACAYMAWHFWHYWVVSATGPDGPEDVLTGLQRWPLKLAFFVGFALLLMQSVAEALRRLAWLRGWSPAPAMDQAS
jgi:TRAP-type mannitol/chloroaromatic compound transport system permease small subunit